jgi:hypothetical protein
MEVHATSFYVGWLHLHHAFARCVHPSRLCPQPLSVSHMRSRRGSTWWCPRWQRACLSAGMPPRGVSHGTTTVSVRALDRLHALLEQEVVKEMSESRRDGAGFLIHGAVRWGQLECVPKATVSTGQEVEERPGLEGPTYSSSTSSRLHCRGLICCLVTVLLNHMYRNEMSDWYIHGAIHCYNRA